LAHRIEELGAVSGIPDRSGGDCLHVAHAAQVQQAGEACNRAQRKVRSLVGQQAGFGDALARVWR
jgi:hypothetical protein